MTSASDGSGGRLRFPNRLAEQIRITPCEIILTGGGGWIGQAVLEMLDDSLGDVLASRVRVFGSNTRELILRSGKTVPCQKLETIRHMAGGAPKLFFHCAFLTKDRLQDQSVDAFIAGNKAISDTVANAIEANDVRGLFMPSSGAVYKKGTCFPRDSSAPKGATAPAYVLDDDLEANPYGVMKRQDEERFLKLAQAKKMPVCIPRLFNLAGPFINKIELYALASMIASCNGGQGITIRAPHRVIRSYIHVADLVTLGFDMLLNPHKDDVPVFDTAGEVAVELSELAVTIRKVLDKPNVAIFRSELVPDKDDKYVGRSEEFTRMMLSHGLTMRPIDVQIHDTADYLACQGSSHAS